MMPHQPSSSGIGHEPKISLGQVCWQGDFGGSLVNMCNDAGLILITLLAAQQPQYLRQGILQDRHVVSPIKCIKTLDELAGDYFYSCVSPLGPTNHRTDRYSGSLENRLRFPLEAVDAIVAAIGKERTAIRVAPFHLLQQTLDNDRIATFERYTEELEERELAYGHIVEPRCDRFSTEGAFSGHREDVDSVDETKKGDALSLWTFRTILKRAPLIGAGGYDAQSAREAIAEGKVDLVAFGRQFTSNPDYPGDILRVFR